MPEALYTEYAATAIAASASEPIPWPSQKNVQSQQQLIKLSSPRYQLCDFKVIQNATSQIISNLFS